VFKKHGWNPEKMYQCMGIMIQYFPHTRRLDRLDRRDDDDRRLLLYDDRLDLYDDDDVSAFLLVILSWQP